MGATNRMQFGPFEVDLAAGELRKRGLKLRLQAQPFGVLACLLERPGEIVTREALQQKLWPDDVFVDFDQGLNKAINKLREALGDSAETPRFIETLPRRGYRFIAPVTALDVDPAAGAVETAPDAKLAEAPRISSRITMILVGGLLLAVIAAGVWFVGLKRTPTLDSLAVLPLTNESKDAEIEYLGDGITESITNKLSQLPNLRVMARSTVFHYKGKDLDSRAIGRELGVKAVLTGRVTQHGDSLIINTELTNVADGTELWGEQYTRKFADVLLIQDEIARQITSKLQLKLTGDQQKLLAHRYTDNTEAYQLYLRGRYHFNKRTEEGFRKAIEYFQEAIAKDPAYGLAYAGLADCYGLQGYDAYAPKDYFPKAKAMANKALEIDDQMAEAFTSLAMVKALYEWDWQGAEQNFRRAIELNPGYATAHHWYGIHLGAMGRFGDARIELQRALELDPLSLIINVNVAYPYHYTHQYDRAIEIYRKAIELDPNFAWAHEDLMAAYEQRGQYKESIQEAILALRLSGETKLAKDVERGNAAGGYRVAVQNWLAGLQEQAKSKYVAPIRLAQVYLLLGETDRAIESLNRAYTERSGQLVYINVDPRYDRVRSDPRFMQLVQKMGLTHH